eukprot:jgi/Chrzof1/10378/Cz04g39210.t1
MCFCCTWFVMQSELHSRNHLIHEADAIIQEVSRRLQPLLDATASTARHTHASQSSTTMQNRTPGVKAANSGAEYGSMQRATADELTDQVTQQAPCP